MNYFLFLVLLCTLASCGRAQDGTQRPSDTIKTLSPIADNAALFATLDSVRKAIRRDTLDDPSDRLIQASYGAFQALGVLARVLDRSTNHFEAIETEIQRFRSDDNTRVGKAGKIVNGATGIYAMYSILYRIRFETDQDRMRYLDEWHNEVVKQMKPSLPAIAVVAALARNSYRMGRDILKSLDTDSLYRNAFEQADERFMEGEKHAVTDEDRYLNSIYRTFEISQLWALFLAPSSRPQIQNINNDFFRTLATETDIGGQLAVAMEYLYRILDLIARNSIHLYH